ncbi:MAG: HAD family hydrolase [Gemmataceae bacterium]|nr:HAD family hydrolase [Gemmataceae bacterium]
MSRRFVVLDRDGTLIVERHYLSDPGQVELLPGVAAGLSRLRDLGLGLVVVTNQSGVGRGYFDEARLDLIHQRLTDLLHVEGVRLDGIYSCPHRPEDGCECRKPRPGLLRQAAEQLGFDARASFVIGDKPCDVELGRAVRATTLLVRTGYGAQFAKDPTVAPDHVVDDLGQAATAIERLLTGPDRVS